MVDDARRRLEKARAGLNAPAEAMLVAGMVAAPFAGTFGIWLSALTWWPNPVIVAGLAVVQTATTLWIAGYRLAGESE